MSEINIVLAYGMTFGILIMSIFYTATRFFYSKEIMYLSYSFMQIFSLVYIFLYSKIYVQNDFLQEIALILATVFAFAFAISFFQGKFIPKLETHKELFTYSLLLTFVFAIVFYHYVLFEYLPYTVIYFLLFISFIFNIKDGIKPTLIYAVGWSMVCLFLYIFKFKTIYVQHGYMDLVLVAFAIEALLFTLSIGYKYQSIQNKNDDMKELLLQQSRLAKSGEMIGNIAHQWRQPLNSLSYILMNLKRKYEKDKLNPEYFEKKISQASSQLQYMSKTIDDFKEFYTPSKNKEEFFVVESINRAITIISADLKKKEIELDFKIDSFKELKVYGISNELSQVILSLLTNAKDAFKDQENKKIEIALRASVAEVIIEVRDNAGGIDKKHIDKIFNAYFTSKEEGTGIGLFLVKTILEKSFDGKIGVKNIDFGACFIIKLAKSV